MKNLSQFICVIVISMMMGFTIQAQTLVEDWGSSNNYTAWPILNTADTPAGNASMGDGNAPTNWTALRGEFSPLQATTTQAVVVKGKLEYVGGSGGSGYTHMRYALTFQDSTTLNYQYSDSAAWVSSKGHSGYGFHPRTGNGTMSNGNGGAGTLWEVSNGNWASTWSNNGVPITDVLQAPRNAEMDEGVYDFAISVLAVDDTTNEISWYLVAEDNSYWFGGTVNGKATSTKFNGIEFGINKDNSITQFNLTGVTVDLGDPIEVPEAPWEPFYIDLWGLSAEYNTAWPILNDSTYLVGDGSMGGEVVSAWKGLQGGFGQDVMITTEKALIVEGEIEFVGADAGDAYTVLRYALTHQEGTTLQNALTDSATWSVQGGHKGYGFHPRTGNGTMSNGNGGVGTVWTIGGGNWASTWSNNGGPIADVIQAPRNAEITAGTYDFAISVISIDDTTNEISWYLIKDDNSYWYGGTVQAASTTKKFNSLLFGVNEVEWTQINVKAAKVDLGDPIEVPEAPWEPFYIDLWGLSAEYNTAWPILNDSTYLVGDGSMGGEVVSAWKGLQGGFGQDVMITTEKALIVEGEIEFVGADAGDAYTVLRYALTHQEGTTLQNALTDSATWSVQGGHKGYGFHPRTGNGTMSNGNGGVGTVWTIGGGNWASTWSNNGGPIADVIQAPRNAEITAGTYDFAISVISIDETTNEISWYLIKDDNSYWYGGTVQAASTTKKFNSLLFGVNEVEWTQINVKAAKVDLGDPIEVPEAPWEAYYVDNWGFLGGRSAGWTLTPGELTGNVSIDGNAGVKYWTALRGEIEEITPKTDQALIVTGKMNFVGGGFEGWTSLRLGLFYSSTAGSLSDDKWNGDEMASGYLFVPPSGTTEFTSWGDNAPGSAGAVVNDSWMTTNGENSFMLGDSFQLPTGAYAGPGEYEFAFSAGPRSDGSNEIRYYINKTGGTYSFGGLITDNSKVIDTYNSFNIALNTHSVGTTELHLSDVKVDRGEHISVPGVVAIEDNSDLLPTEYALNQNYPNPFNPTTTIEFAIPKSGNVSLVVFDILGRQVAELVQGQYDAGYFKVNFDASNLASGIYFYRLETNSFVSVKKLMLLK